MFSKLQPNGGEQSDNLTAKLEQKDEQASQHDKPRNGSSETSSQIKKQGEHFTCPGIL